MADIHRYTVKPGVSNIITIKGEALESYICYEDGQKNHIKLYANSTGVVRIPITPNADCQSTVKLNLDSASKKHVLHLCASHKDSKEYPFHILCQPTPASAAVHRALTVDEAHSLKDEELAARGYTPRACFGTGPEASEKWLKAVTTACTVVEARLVKRKDIGSTRRKRHQVATTDGTETSPNWCALEIRNASGGRFGGAWAAWIVPFLTLTPGQHTYVSIWVGIDGDETDAGPSDLVQCGTTSEILSSPSGMVLTPAYAWQELLPNEPTSVVIPDFVVNPGDHIFCNFIMGFGPSLPDFNAPTATFWFRNDTTHVITAASAGRGATLITGSEAEFVVERPGLPQPDGTIPLSGLANFGTINITGPRARLASDVGIDPIFDTVQDAQKLIPMTNTAGTATLATVKIVDDDTAAFTWLGSS